MERSGFNRGAYRGLCGEQKKTDLTAEHAEVTSAIAGHKDIFFSFSFSGAASLIFVFLCALSDLRGEQKRSEKCINICEYMHLVFMH